VASAGQIDMKVQLTATVLAPGDTLVVAVSRRLTDWERDQMAADFRTNLPGVKVALIEQCSGLATYHPDPDVPDLPTLT